MTKYETMLITSATLDEEATEALVGKFKTLIEANGTIDGIDEWGKRRLAYPIQKQNDGIYTLIHFTSGPDFPAELDRVYKITDGVLRSLIIAKPPGEEYKPPVKETKPEPPKAVEAEPVKQEEAPQAEQPVEEPKAEEPAAAEEAAPAAQEPEAEQNAEG